MEADTQASIDAQAADTQEARPRRRPDIGFDAKLAPTCMVWSMIIALGFLITTMFLWGVSNISMIFK